MSAWNKLQRIVESMGSGNSTSHGESGEVETGEVQEDLKNRLFQLSVTPAESQVLLQGFADWIGQNGDSLGPQKQHADSVHKKLEKLDQHIVTSLKGA